MFRDCTSLVEFNASLSSLTDGLESILPFTATTGELLIPIKSFTSDLSSYTGNVEFLFLGTILERFDASLSSLENGQNMFSNCGGLSSFTSDLSSLTNGNYMFSNCSSLVSFISDLPKLVDGELMFGACTALTNWGIPLPNLINGSRMFFLCSNLTSFTSDLSSLTDSTSMFDNCTALANVILSGTLNCNNLSFSASTILTVDSLMNIINALVDRNSTSSYTLKLGSTNLAKLSTEQKAIATNKNWILS